VDPEQRHADEVQAQSVAGEGVESPASPETSIAPKPEA